MAESTSRRVDTIITSSLIQLSRSSSHRHTPARAAMDTARCLVLAAALLSAQGKMEERRDSPCQEFSRGVRFNDSQAVGSWRLLRDRLLPPRPGRPEHCALFAPTTPQERQELSESVGQYLANLQWDRLTLKMQVPCEGAGRVYYLERLGPDGSYRTLQVPTTIGSAKPDLSSLQRHPLRLKLVEQYLALMDCRERVTLLLARDDDLELPARLRRIVQVYWPDE